MEKTITCRQCGKQFIFTESEQEFYKQKGFTLPNHCRDCRLTKRNLNPVLCSKCGNKLVPGSGGYCTTCVGNVQLEFELEAKKLKEALSEVKAKLSAVETEKVQLVDTLNAKIIVLESEKSQIASEASAKLNAVESEKTKQLDEAEEKLGVVESENTCLSTLLEQEKQLTAKLQEQISNMRLELEKALKYRATLDLLEPTLSAINERLEALARTQNSISQTMAQWIRGNGEIHQNGGLMDVIRRILKPGRKS